MAPAPPQALHDTDTDARIYIDDGEHAIAQALAIRDGRIVYVLWLIRADIIKLLGRQGYDDWSVRPEMS